MKKNNKMLPLYCMIVILLVSLMFIKCRSHGAGSLGFMEWVYQGNTMHATSDTAFEFANTVDGYFTTTPSSANQHVEVSLQGAPGPNLAAGTYTVGGGPNSVYIWIGSNPVIGAVSGQVIISNKTADWVSGTFDVMLSNGQHFTGRMEQVPTD